MGDALRNTGYKSIDSAVAEIVDNSIEAEAKNVFIVLREKVNDRSNRKVVSEIAFLDNGNGMNLEVLSECLGIGDTTKMDRTGMGRFGVGLPQASLYACPFVEVYSWQNGIDNCYKVFLDIDKVKSGEQTEIDDPELVGFPHVYKKYLTYRDCEKEFNFLNSGTLVIWRDCDHLLPKTRKALIEKLEFSLGQKFRYFIANGDCEIKLICHDNEQMNCNVFPNDPLMLLENNYVLGNVNEPKRAYYPNEQKGRDDLVPIFEPYTNENNQTGVVEIPVRYYDKNGDIQSGIVTAKFSVVKPEFYSQQAIKEGRNPGSYDIGKHVHKLEGISVIRANREIDFRSFDFYDNTNTPQHRWWGCEISFDPCMDEAFGVANNKQYVELKEIDEEEIDLDGDEIPPMWLQLKRVIMSTIKAMKARNKEMRASSNQGDGNDGEQPVSVDIINEIEERNEEDSISKGQMDNLTEEERIDKIQETYQVDRESARRFAQNKVYIEYHNYGAFHPAFDYRFELGIIRITINTGHIFYTAFLEKIYEVEEATKTTFELFLASFVKAVDITSCLSDEQERANDRLVSKWLEKITEYTMEQRDNS